LILEDGEKKGAVKTFELSPHQSKNNLTCICKTQTNIVILHQSSPVMRNLYLAIAFLIPLSATLEAQSIQRFTMSSAGNHQVSASAQLSWALGQSASGTFQSNQAIANTGYHQYVAPPVLSCRDTVLYQLILPEGTTAFMATCEEASGTFSNTLSLTDSYRQTTSCILNIEVYDTTAPQPICLERTVQLKPNGRYPLKPSDVLDIPNSRDNCSIQEINFPPTRFTCAQVGETYAITVTLSDPSGNSKACVSNVTVEPGGVIPPPWQTVDVGTGHQSTEYFYNPCDGLRGTLNIKTQAINSFNNGTNDNLATVTRPLCNNGSIQAKLENIDPGGYIGLILRSGESSGAAFVGLFSNLSSLLRWETRYQAGEEKSVTSFFRPFPAYLRLTRSGNWITGQFSQTGSTFSHVHAVYWPQPECLEAGLAAFSIDPGNSISASLSDIRIQQQPPVAPLQQANPQTGFEGNASLREVQLSLFPNPASEQITLAFKNPLPQTLHSVIINAAGQIVTEKTLPAEVSTHTWPIDHLPPGTYWIQLALNPLSPLQIPFIKQ
jgi:hypothetical protein